MTNQIESMGFTTLSVALHCDHHYQTSSLIIGIGADKLHIETLYSEYKELVTTEANIVHRQTAYVSTEQLKEADKERDNILGVTMQIIHAHCASTISAKRNAALALEAITAPYKGIGRSEYRSETREIAGLLAVLNSEEASTHITTLHLTDEVAELAMKNAAFEAVMGQKLQEEVGRTPQTNISTDELRKLVDTKYAEIVQMVNAYAIVQPSAEIEDFITQMNALITLTKRSAAAQGKGKKDKEEPTPDTPDAPENGEETDIPETPETPPVEN